MTQQSTARDPLWIRICIVTFLLSVLFVFLLRHVYIIQVDRHEELEEKARHKYTKIIKSIGARGKIFDGSPNKPNLLATNIITFDAYLDPWKDKRLQKFGFDKALKQINELVKIDKEQVIWRYKNTKKALVEKQISRRDKLHLEALEIPGLIFEKSTKRFLPKDSLAAHIIGFTNSESKGLQGIEKVFDKELQPRAGKEIIQRAIGQGKIYTADHEETAKAYDGNDIYLTIQEPIQSIVEAELPKMVEKFRCKGAYAIMADPKTGNIMAMAQYPSFNPNDKTDMDPDNYRNRILEDGFEPGSVMKALSISAVLSKNRNVNLNTEFYCEKGRWLYAGKILRDAGHAYKNLSVKEIVQKSSNIGTAKAVLTLPPKQFYGALRRFGLNQKTQLNLGLESRGVMLEPKNWDKLTQSRYAMGQTLVTTPLQMIQAYCGIANGGYMPQLRIVDRIFDQETQEMIQIPLKPGRQVIRPDVAEDMVAALKTVTKEGGTAKKAAIPGFDVAGKTGTTQKLEGRYSEEVFMNMTGTLFFSQDTWDISTRQGNVTVKVEYDKAQVQRRFEKLLQAGHTGAITIEGKLKLSGARTGSRNILITALRDEVGNVRTKAAVRVGGDYSSRYYIASFMGFVPADNPRFVLYIVADEPDKSISYYGGTVTGPTFRAIAEQTLSYMNISPEGIVE